ncbi:hypothetical protein V6N13_142568 [Hibiscus sabdariffa]|uniref:Uncharacterized protein n=1 Tax=Hibiscus sabdariffa TaxID=183260 RepID=A0ABR2FEM9_9ROSI
MTARFKRLKTEMAEISIEQEVIKEGQRQVRTKIEDINEECEQLREATKQIIQQSANTQIRLAIMFNILKAREEGDFAKTRQLTQLLRNGACKNDLNHGSRFVHQSSEQRRPIAFVF